MAVREQLQLSIYGSKLTAEGCGWALNDLPMETKIFIAFRQTESLLGV